MGNNFGNNFFSIAALIYNILLLLVYFSKQRVKTFETNIYGYLIISSFAITINAVMCYYTILYKDIIPIINDIISKALLICYLIWIMLFTIYIIGISRNSNNKSLSSKVIYSFLIAFIVICFAIATSPLYYNNENNLVYSYGPAANILFFGCGIMVCLWLYLIIRNITKLKNKKLIPLFVLLFLGSVVIYIQKVKPEMLLLTFTISFITFLMYFTIENPDIKMIEQLEISKDQADKANNAKTEFLSSMSHEIRTPLNAIVGFSESLKEDEIPKESMEKVEDIIMASNNLLEIVNGILDISKIEANKLEIVEKEYEIEELWDELIILTKARIGDRGIDFRVNIDPTIPKVLYGDNTRLKQVILNVLTNAAKYTKEGFVDFRVSSVIKDNVVKLIISVEDSGIGIKEENLPRLFSKFDRLSVEKSITIEGTGLGLAITKKLVELMGGKIVVQSIYGKGSKFTIIVDQKIVSNEIQHQKETTESNTTVIDIKGSKVLLVDDNELNIKVASTLLKKYNLNIDSCTNGFDCIEKINKGETYDIILLDDMMPKMSGKETLVKLKQINNFNIPVIALTANAIEGMKEEYLKAGFSDYLSKPIEKKELERVLRTYIAKKSISNTNTTNTEKTTSIIPENIAQGINTTEKEEKVVEHVQEPKKIDLELPSLKIEEENDKKGKVLVVDDDLLNIKVAINLISKYVGKVDTVNSGSECIAKIIEDDDYDLILMDDMMPELDGPTTMDNLRDIEGFNIPVILLTANEFDSAVEEKIDNHHFAGYLGKPIDKEELTKTLTKFIK